MNRVPLFLAAGLLAIGGFVMLASSDDKEESEVPEAAATPDPAATEQAEAPPKEEALAQAAADPDPEAEREAPDPVSDGAEDGAAAGGEPNPALAAAAEGDAAATDATASEAAPSTKPTSARSRTPRAGGKDRPTRPKAPKPASAGPKAAATANDEPKPPAPVAAAPKPDPAAEVAAALKAGWMLESGSLLLVFPSKKPMTWEAAAALCRRRKDAGLTQWRLARFGELVKLRDARAMPAGTWWSSTNAEDDSQARTLAPTQASALSKADGGALPLCVHARPVA